MSHKANDYIIKDGEFIRDFESMYEEIEDPWGQNKIAGEDISIVIALRAISYFVLKKNISVKNIMDIGCADGYHLKNFSDNLKLSEKGRYFGTDISETVIKRAISESKTSFFQLDFEFHVDDIRKKNKLFVDKMNVIFCSRTIYYVAPEIEVALDNITSYISKEGIFCFIYNQKEDSFSNKWLTYESLRGKLLDRGYNELLICKNFCFSDEITVIGVYQIS